MKRSGIISNRIFDAIASEAFVITDDVVGLDEALPGCVVTYSDKADLAKKIDYYLAHDSARREVIERGRKLISQHTFDSRVEAMIKVLQALR